VSASDIMPAEVPHEYPTSISKIQIGLDQRSVNVLRTTPMLHNRSSFEQLLQRSKEATLRRESEHVSRIKSSLWSDYLILDPPGMNDFHEITSGATDESDDEEVVLNVVEAEAEEEEEEEDDLNDIEDHSFQPSNGGWFLGEDDESEVSATEEDGWKRPKGDYFSKLLKSRMVGESELEDRIQRQSREDRIKEWQERKRKLYELRQKIRKTEQQLHDEEQEEIENHHKIEKLLEKTKSSEKQREEERPQKLQKSISGFSDSLPPLCAPISSPSSRFIQLLMNHELRDNDINDNCNTELNANENFSEFSPFGLTELENGGFALVNNAKCKIWTNPLFESDQTKKRKATDNLENHDASVISKLLKSD